MSIAEIEAAIEKLSPAQLEELARWLDATRAKLATPVAVDGWLQQSRGVALPGASTDSIMALTRGEG
jgi:hypothetical protein